MADDRNRPEQPRVEPEIIPPGRNSRHSPWSPYGFTETHRIHITRVGPLGIALLMLAIAAVATIIIIAILGAVLIWIPVVALVLIVGALLRLVRR